MRIYDLIKNEYPTISDDLFINGTIVIQDDSDGKGEFLSEWNCLELLPATLVIGKVADVDASKA